MGQAENLLNSLGEIELPHEHHISDPDGHFIIDPDTRQIVSASNSRNVLMQFDHNSEIYTFELPRYIENHDMTLCNRVLLHYINIDGKTAKEYADVVELTDMAISEDDEEKVTVSWLISRHATQAAGTLNFLVQFMCVDADGNIDYEWHTDVYDEVYVNASRTNGKQAVLKYSNILEQWRHQLFDAGNSVIATAEDQIEAIVAEGTAQLKAIEEAGDAIMDGIEFGIQTDETLEYTEDKILQVNTADKVESNNNLPVTSAAVYNALGVIENGSY